MPRSMAMPMAMMAQSAKIAMAMFTALISLGSGCGPVLAPSPPEYRRRAGGPGKNLTAQSGMGLVYELDAIAMAVIGGVSLTGGRGSIIGTALGMLIFGVIISGFTYLKLDAFYQEMAKGAIIVAAVVLDQWRQQRAASKA